MLHVFWLWQRNLIVVSTKQLVSIQHGFLSRPCILVQDIFKPVPLYSSRMAPDHRVRYWASCPTVLTKRENFAAEFPRGLEKGRQCLAILISHRQDEWWTSDQSQAAIYFQPHIYDPLDVCLIRQSDRSPSGWRWLMKPSAEGHR